MGVSSGPGVDDGLVEELLALPTPEEQAAFLGSRGLPGPGDLDRLLEVAEGLVADEPRGALRLAELCAGIAGRAGANAVVPRADYVRAQAYAVTGDLEAELRLTEAARDGYLALGERTKALRTNVGLMGVLAELGRYGEALEVGGGTLGALGAAEGAEATAREAELLTALVNQNLGLCYEYMGRYADALGAYASAEGRYRALGEKGRLAEILDNRGAVLLYLGRGGEALDAHEAAAAIFEEAGPNLSQARALSNIGQTYLYLGDYERGLDALQRARRLLDALGALADKHLLLRDVADAYLEMNLYPEALAAYEEANAWLRDAGLEHGRAQTLWGIGSALVALSDFGRAESALSGAARRFAAAGNAPMLSGVMLEQASLRAARGDRGAALEAAREALDLVSQEEWPVQRVYAHMRLSDLMPLGDDEAETHLLEARRIADRLALPHLRYRLDERLGRLRLAQGRGDEAEALLEAAIGEIERLRGTIAREAMRASFLRDKTAAYDDLLLLRLARADEGSARRAFAVAERARSRTLADLLTGKVGPSRENAGDGEVRQLQADLNATYNRLLGAFDADEHDTPVPDLHGRAVELEREIGRRRLERAATTDPFEAPETPGKDALDSLPSDTTLVAYHVSGDEILAFVGDGDGVRVVRRLCSADAVARMLRALDAQWDRFLAGPEFAGRHAVALERSARRTLGVLYDALLVPLEPLLRGTRGANPTGAPRKLVVIPHGLLHGVPFHALFDGEGYALERFEISYAPSARVYALCQEGAPRELDDALIVSVPDPLIPAVGKEAGAVARSLPGSEVLGDGRATTAAFKGLSRGRGVLHLACHGLFRSDSPMFSSLKLSDGWLTAAEVLEMDLSGALVVLSACESGRNEVFAGDELVGLTRAFLGAGASTLAASMWVVHDETTASLMGRYYAGLRAGAGPAEALRTAQLAIKAERPHPYYWAPFVLMGKR